MVLNLPDPGGSKNAWGSMLNDALSNLETGKVDQGELVLNVERHAGATDAERLQAAVDAADAQGGGLVFVPALLDLGAVGVTIPPGVTLVGGGRRTSVIEYSGTEWALTFQGSDATDMRKGGGLKGLAVSLTAAGSNGIRGIDPRHLAFEDFAVLGGGGGASVLAGTGMQLEYGASGCAWNKLSGFYIEYCGSGLLLDGGGSSWANRNFAWGGHVQSCTDYGVRLIDASTNQIQVSAQNCGTGLSLEDTSSDNYCLVWQESSTVAAVNVDAGCDSNWIIGALDPLVDNGNDTSIWSSDRFRVPVQATPLVLAAPEAGGTMQIYPDSGETGSVNVYVRDAAGALAQLMQWVGGSANSRLRVVSELEVEGALNHDGAAVGFNGAAPVGKAADPGVATGTDAVVINALVTALRNLGLVT